MMVLNFFVHVLRVKLMCVCVVQGFGSVLLGVLPAVRVHRPGRVSHGVCRTHMDADCT